MIFLQTLLPVLWACVATVIGMVLYKSSNALFEQKSALGGETKRLRLAGSVTIAAVAFIGMWYSTPSEALSTGPDGFSYYSDYELRRAADFAEQASDKSLLLAACITEDLSGSCSAQMQELQTLTGRIEQQITKVQQSKPGAPAAPTP